MSLFNKILVLFWIYLVKVCSLWIKKTKLNNWVFVFKMLVKMIDYNIIPALYELIWLLQKKEKINISPFWAKQTFTTSSMWMTLYHTRKSPSVCTINLETAAGKTVLAEKINNFSCHKKLTRKTKTEPIFCWKKLVWI